MGRAGIAGYVSGAQNKMFGGSSWVRNVLLTATLFCGPLLVTFSFLNTVAIAYRSTAALPFGTICIIVVIWVLVSGQMAQSALQLAHWSAVVHMFYVSAVHAVAAASSSYRHEISQGDRDARDLLQVTFPLTVLGGIMGKNTRMEFNPPTRTTKCALFLPSCHRQTGSSRQA